MEQKHQCTTTTTKSGTVILIEITQMVYQLYLLFLVENKKKNDVE